MKFVLYTVSLARRAQSLPRDLRYVLLSHFCLYSAVVALVSLTLIHFSQFLTSAADSKD